MGERVLTELGEKWRSWLPTIVRDSPDHLAVLHAVAVEVERLEAAIERVQAQFFPQTADELGLVVWEHQLRTTIAPVGQTVAQRRSTVLALLLRMRGTPEGQAWEEAITALVGPGWSYEEHDPADPGSPAPYTILVHLPFDPGAGQYAQAEAALAKLTPAHLDIVLAQEGGFVLDVSQLDLEAL